MFVQGGVGNNNEILSKLSILDLNKYLWISSKINNTMPELTNHSACLVMLKAKAADTNLNIFKTIDLGNSINKEGIYLFGGIDKSLNYSNVLYRIKLFKNIFEIEKVNANGIPPSERSNCSLNYFEDLNVIILHGGHNETQNKFFNDTYVFDIVSSNWINMKLSNELNEPILERCSHSSVILKNELIIFGGNNEMYLGTDLFIITLDFEKFHFKK
jgi:hypothetical protein